MAQTFAKISKVLAASLHISSDELAQAFCRAARSDLPELCELMRMGFGEVENLKSPVLAWRYMESSSQGSDIFIFRHQGKIIGAVGAEPITVSVNGADVDGVRCGDIVVHPDYMKCGIGAWMNLYLQHHFAIVMAMGSNENSTSMVRRMYTAINCRHHFKLLISTKRYGEFRRWSPWLIAIINFITILPLAVCRFMAFKKLPVGYQLVVSENTDVLQRFFESQYYQPRSLNTVKRSLSFCRWRYDLNPRSQFTVLSLHQQHQILGYAIVKKNSHHDTGDWQLMDWDFLPHLRNEAQYRLLFSAVIKWVVEKKAESLSVMASDSLSVGSLRRAGLSLRALEDGFYLWAKLDVDPKVFDKDHWFISLSDTDEAL